MGSSSLSQSVATWAALRISSYNDSDKSIQLKTVMLQTEIGLDGKLRLEVPTDLPPGPAEVVVVVEPKQLPHKSDLRSLSGMLAGKLPADIDPVAEVREIRRRATEQALELPE
jgi:hypothetical protein